MIIAADKIIDKKHDVGKGPPVGWLVG